MRAKEILTKVGQRSLLYEVSRSFSTLIELEQLIPFVIAKTKELLNTESSAIFLLDDEKKELFIPFAADQAIDVETKLREVRFPADRGIAGWVVQHGIPQLVRDVTQDERWNRNVDKKTGVTTHSLLCAPLRTRLGVIGVVSLRNKLQGEFTDEDLEFLNTLAGSIAIAIENASLYGKLKESEAKLRDEIVLLNREMAERKRAEEALREEAAISAALARVGQELISSLNTSAVLERLCQLTAEVVGCDRSHTLMWEPDEDAFKAVAGFGITAEEQEIARVVKIPREAMGAVLESLQSDDVAESGTVAAELLPVGRLRQLSSGIHLCMALRRGAQVIGIQFAGYRGREGSFTPTQRRIARGVAQLASMGLENARLVEELERANRLKSDFVAAMSHELRTPLHIIMGYNGLLMEGSLGPVTSQQSDMLKRMGKNAKDLLALINATLDLSRLEAGRVQIERREVVVGGLLEEFRKETEELQKKKGVGFVWDVPNDLPPVQTDAGKCKVVLTNLLDNAAKFTIEGTVTVSAVPRDGGVEIAFADTGVGIDPQIMPVIFESFRQGENSMTRRFGGVGMGLYVVRRLLDLLGGRISVESEVDKGSTFRVWLPTTEALEKAQRVARED